MNASAVKILVIEDEETVRAALYDNLTYEGYQVLTSENGQTGIELFRESSPDLVILDVMMPGIDGLQVCRMIRAERSQTPIIMLTAKGAEIDKVVGLEIGADDYLTKPFGMRELFARIKALLRRVESNVAREEESEGEELERLEIGEVVIDFRSYRAFRGDDEIALSAKEFELLRFLALRSDIPVSRDELLDNVWGYTSYPSTRTVDNFIARLRSKLELSPEKPRHIITVHGVGYKFVQ